MTTIPDDVLDVLRRCAIGAGTLTLPEQLDRKLYLATNKVLAAIGAKWDRKSKCHIFEGGIPTDVLSQIHAKGEFLDVKKELGFFETPVWLAIKMRTLCAPRIEDLVLEPSAGRGAIIRTLDQDQRITAVELAPDNAKHLRDIQQLYSLGGRPKRMEVFERDFLPLADEWRAQRRFFDVVLMNPPFAHGADVIHFLTAFLLLKKGGRIACITSPHFEFAEDRRSTDFREFLKAADARIEKLPEGTFKDSGTNVNTRLIFAVRSR